MKQEIRNKKPSAKSPAATPVECEVLPPDAGTSTELLAAGGGASVATLVERINDHLGHWSAVIGEAVATLVERINDHHARAQNDAAHAKAYGQSAVRSAILAGLQLVELKAATPHGQWEAMFTSGLKRVGKAGAKANANHGSHLDFDSRTALKYIAVATQLVTKKLQPEQSAVLLELARGGEMNADAAALLDEIVPDKSLRQAYLELGIVKPTQKEAAWLSAAADPQESDADPAAPSAASKLRSAKDCARIDWYGTAKIGMVEPGSIVGMILNELNFSATGKGESTLRLLRADELEGMAEDFRRIAKVAADYAKGKH